MGVHFEDALADGQAKAGAFAGGVGAVGGEETVEDVGAVLGENAGAVISDTETIAVCVLCLCGEGDEAGVGGELDGVVKEIYHYLLNAV